MTQTNKLIGSIWKHSETKVQWLVLPNDKIKCLEAGSPDSPFHVGFIKTISEDFKIRKTFKGQWIRIDFDTYYNEI